jgi:hypothetical protein
LSPIDRDDHCADGQLHYAIARERSAPLQRIVTGIVVPDRSLTMAIVKRELSDTPDGRWRLVYDPDNRAFYVEATGLHGTQRIDIDTALRMTGADADELRLAIVDLFKAD